MRGIHREVYTDMAKDKKAWQEFRRKSNNIGLFKKRPKYFGKP